MRTWPTEFSFAAVKFRLLAVKAKMDYLDRQIATAKRNGDHADLAEYEQYRQELVDQQVELQAMQKDSDNRRLLDRNARYATFLSKYGRTGPMEV